MPTNKRVEAVTDLAGRRYAVDGERHRIVVHEPGGRRWSFGRRGPGPGELQAPGGVAILPEHRPEGARLFVADTGNHRIQVFDGLGRPLLAFGGQGSTAGRFYGPSGVALARPDLPWEGRAGEPGPAVLVVADEGNNRLQVFDLDFGWLATIGTAPSGPAASAREHVTQGWPFFRVAPAVPLDAPARLEWRAPWLLVGTSDARRVRIDLAGAMLPQLDEWLDRAPRAERDHACRYFTLLQHHPRALPPPVARQVGLAAAA